MKAITEKFIPWVLILLGGLRLLSERFPGRLGALPVISTPSLGWIFWILGIAGLLQPVFQRAVLHSSTPAEAGQTGGSGIQTFFRKYGMDMLILLLTAASLSMLIRSGYYWDDAVNSTAYLAEKKDSISTLDHVLTFMRKYLELGRINILSIYYYFFFYIENVSVYKALIILTILIDQLIFRNVLMEYGVSRAGSRLGMLLIPLMLQTRAYQDPVSGFYSLMQVLTAEMLLCALFLRRWLVSGKAKPFWFSLVIFGIGLLTYEVCFPFLAMICLIILCHRKNFWKTVRDSLPFAGLTLLMLGAVYLVRNLFFRTEYPGVAFNLELPRVLRAALTQLSAGLPLSFYSADYPSAVMGHAYPAGTFLNYSFLSFLGAVQLSDILILVVSLLVIRKLHASAAVQSSSKVPLTVLGISFAVLPMITVALSERYQGQLMPGLGYLPVYMQYYGVTVLLLCLILFTKPSAGKQALFTAAFAVILLLNLQNNRAVTKIMNRSFYEARNAGEAALHGGILDFLPRDAVLISVNDRRFIWESDWNNRGLYTQFYGNNARHIPETIGDESLLQNAVEEALSAGASQNSRDFLEIEPENVWIIAYNGRQDTGFCRLGHALRLEIDPDSFEIQAAETDRVLYFISGDHPDPDTVLYTAADGTFRQLPLTEQQRIRQTGYGILYRLPESERILFSALTLDPSAF